MKPPLPAASSLELHQCCGLQEQGLGLRMKANARHFGFRLQDYLVSNEAVAAVTKDAHAYVIVKDITWAHRNRIGHLGLDTVERYGFCRLSSHPHTTLHSL